MSQEKTLEKYKNKKWLEDQYIKQGKTIKQISEEFGYSKTTLSRYKDRFELKKNKTSKNKNSYANKDWLYEKYICENKTAIEIAEICGVNRGLIFEYIARFNLKKEENNKSVAYKARVKDISIEKYGVPHFNSAEEILEKRRSTNLEKYGKETYLGSKEHRNKYEKKVFAEKSLYEWGLEKDISNIILYRWLDKNPTATDEDFLSFINLYEPRISNIENIFHQKMGFNFYNKYFDLENHSLLKYKPDFKISDKCAVNVDGLYWHSELHKNNFYHYNMRFDYESRDLRIFQFRGDEINYKFDIVKSIINNYLGESKKIYARKTVVKKVSHQCAKKFLNENHLMGSTKAKHIGLFSGNDLVMIFSYKMYGSAMKVERLCGKKGYVIVGGFSKLLKYAVEKCRPKEIKYWVDLRYGTGNYLKGFGFKHKKDTLGWKWTDFKKTYNRLKCRANMDERGLSEKKHAQELGWYKIYDAGQRLYVKEIK